MILCSSLLLIPRWHRDARCSLFLSPSIAIIRFWNKSWFWKCVGTNIVKLIPVVFPDSLDARARMPPSLASTNHDISISFLLSHRRCLDLILRVTSLFPSWKREVSHFVLQFSIANQRHCTRNLRSWCRRSFPAAENSHITKKHRDIKSPRKYYKGLCLKHLLIYLLGSRLYRHLPLHLPARRSCRLQISSWEKQWWEKTLISFKHVDIALLFSGKGRIKK